MQGVHFLQGDQNLLGVGLNSLQIKVLGMKTISIIKVIFEEFSDEHQVLTMVKVIVEGEKMGFIGMTIG